MGTWYADYNSFWSFINFTQFALCAGCSLSMISLLSWSWFDFCLILGETVSWLTYKCSTGNFYQSYINDFLMKIIRKTVFFGIRCISYAVFMIFSIRVPWNDLSSMRTERNVTSVHAFGFLEDSKLGKWCYHITVIKWCASSRWSFLRIPHESVQRRRPLWRHTPLH